MIEDLAKKYGCEILVEHCNYSGNDFKYFVYKGQKIWIEQPGTYGGAKCFWTSETVSNLDKLMKTIDDERIFIHCKVEDYGDYFSFIWGEREPLGAFEFSLDKHVAKAERGLSLRDLHEYEN